MKALVLGGNGFIGMNVVRALVQTGHEVTATRRERSNTLFARKLGAKLVQADLDQDPDLPRLLEGYDVVFDCASHYPRYSLDLAAEVAMARRRARRIAMAARQGGVGRYVLTSSVATVGSPRAGRTLSTEEDAADPRARRSVYHAVKLAVEEEVLEAAVRGLPAVVLCPTGVVGELDVKAGTGFVMVALAHGRLRFYVEGRTNIVDADQLAAAHLAAAERGQVGERYIVAGHNTTIGEFLRVIAEHLGVKPPIRRVPVWLAGPIATLDERRCRARPGRSRRFLAREFVDIVRFGVWVDGAKATETLGLQSPLPLFETVRKACRWYERHRYWKPRGPAADST